MARVKRGVVATPSVTKKYSKLVQKVTTVARSRRVFRVAVNKRSSKPVSTLTVTVARRKRQFRALWIARINAGARISGSVLQAA
jgi:large subunit ribosomal protein L20